MSKGEQQSKLDAAFERVMANAIIADRAGLEIASEGIRDKLELLASSGAPDVELDELIAQHFGVEGPGSLRRLADRDPALIPKIGR